MSERRAVPATTTTAAKPKPRAANGGGGGGGGISHVSDDTSVVTVKIGSGSSDGAAVSVGSLDGTGSDTTTTTNGLSVGVASSHGASGSAAVAAAAATTTTTGGGGTTGSHGSAASHQGYCTALLNLEVKVLTQPLGAENQWAERGDGRVEFTDFTIRVIGTKGGSDSDEDDDDEEDRGCHGNNTNVIILKDTITSETPFVGENCCIVWNSFEQQLSLCLMYASEEGYSASWSALVALQDKAYPPFRVDLLNSCLPPGLRAAAASSSLLLHNDNGDGGGEDGTAEHANSNTTATATATSADSNVSDGDNAASTKTTAAAAAAANGDAATKAKAVSAASLDSSNHSGASLLSSSVAGGAAATAGGGGASSEVLPYSYYIHDKYDPPLGFIENHALSLCVVENNHALRRELYAERATALTLLNVANADLLEHLLGKDAYPMLATSLGTAVAPTADKDWSIPDSLGDLSVPEDLSATVSKDMRLSHLQTKVLRPADKSTDLTLKLSAISHRLRNELTCALLSSDSTLQQAREALMIAPPSTASAAAAVCHRLSGDAATTTGGNVNANSGASRSTSATSGGHPTTNTPTSSGRGDSGGGSGLGNAGSSPATVIEACLRAERQALAHLHFFRSLVSLSIAELGKELVGPVVVKVFQSGLLEALSLVAEHFAMPAGASQGFVGGVQDCTTSSTSNSNASGNANSSSSNPSNNGNRRTSLAGGGNMGGPCPNWYSPAVEAELTMLLDVTLVRLNERQEEQLMNELVRSPILREPAKYNGIVTFMLRQLALGNAAGAGGLTSGWSPSSTLPSMRSCSGGVNSGAAANRRSCCSGGAAPPSFATRSRVLHENMSTRNPYILFHVLGLHDDEGSAAAERALDPESTEIRNKFHNFIITKYIFQASRGSLLPVPPPPGGPLPAGFSNFNGTTNPTNSPGASSIASSSGVAAAYASVLNMNGNSLAGVKSPGFVQFNGNHSSSPGGVALPHGISPAFIRVLEYLITLSTTENREALLKVVFNHRSNIMSYIESCLEITTSNARAVGLDVLCCCVRFIRTIIDQIAMPNDTDSTAIEDNPMALFATPPEPILKSLVTTICRQLTVERDTFGIILRAYHKIGGFRRNTVFHSSILSLLELIDHHVPSTRECHDRDDAVRHYGGNNTHGGNGGGATGSSSNDLRDIRDYLFLKHLSLLPSRFERKFREALLFEVSSRLGRDSYTPNNSVSVLSSTASEMLRSSSKLRFVDEVEAAIGGVDGTVLPETVANLSPVVVGNVHTSEERLSKKHRLMIEMISGSPTGAAPHAPPPARAPTAGGGAVGVPTHHPHSGSSTSGIKAMSRPHGRAISPSAATTTTSSSGTPSTPANVKVSVGGGGGAANSNGVSRAASPPVLVPGVTLSPQMPTTERPIQRPRSGGGGGALLMGVGGDMGDAVMGRATPPPPTCKVSTDTAVSSTSGVTLSPSANSSTDNNHAIGSSIDGRAAAGSGALANIVSIPSLATTASSVPVSPTSALARHGSNGAEGGGVSTASLPAPTSSSSPSSLSPSAPAPTATATATATATPSPHAGETLVLPKIRKRTAAVAGRK